MNSAELKQLDKLIEKFCAPEWRELAQQHTTTLDFRKGELILKEGQKAENIFMVKQGRVKVFSNYTDQIEVIVRFATDGQVIGHRGFGEDFTFSISAVALSDTSVYILPMSIFQSLLKANNLFCYYFMMFFAEELRRSERMRKNQLNMSVKQRVAQAIRMNMESFGLNESDPGLLSFTLSRRDIASLAGTTYESVIRSLAELQNDGIIGIEGKKLRITNIDALCAMTLCSKDLSQGPIEIPNSSN
ncbi:MAG: Crp/Fnr family transcriptional regulator [Flavobacteriales bacterium]|nr:Crp/Fnr family transcriptional regulator [Flavobacteriales bacterium]